MIREFISTLLDRWANLNPIVRFLLVAGVGGGIALVTAKPAYRVFREWRMERNLVEARRAVQETRMQEARDLSLTVLRSGNPNIEAFRILEKSAAALGDPRHAEIARALTAHPEGNDDDRLTGFLAVVADMPLGLVGQTWSSLPDACRTSAEFAVPFARRLLDEQRLGEAAGVLTGVPQEARDLRVRQLLARVLIASRKRDGYAEAQRLIAAGLAGDGSGETAGWLDVLEEIPVPSLEETLLGPVRALPDEVAGVEPARLALLRVRMDYAAQWPQRKAILDAAIRTWRERSPEHVARFLHHLGLHRLLLETYPVQGIETYPGLLPLLLDAAAQSGDWDSLRQLLDAAGSRLPQHTELAQRALLAAKAEDANARAEAVRAAISEAKRDPSNHALLALHRMAAGHGLDELAATAMLEAIRQGRGPLPLYEQQKSLCRWLAESGQENALLEICAIYLTYEPSNPILLTQYAYLACLNDVIEPAKLLPPLELLARAFPKELPIHLTLATAHLCGGQAEQAAAVLEPFALDDKEVPPAFRIVYLTSLVLNGKIPADDPRIEGFPWNKLQAQERRKFSTLLRGEPRTPGARTSVRPAPAIQR